MLDGNRNSLAKGDAVVLVATHGGQAVLHSLAPVRTPATTTPLPKSHSARGSWDMSRVRLAHVPTAALEPRPARGISSIPTEAPTLRSRDDPSRTCRSRWSMERANPHELTNATEANYVREYRSSFLHRRNLDRLIFHLLSQQSRNLIPVSLRHLRTEAGSASAPTRWQTSDTGCQSILTVTVWARDDQIAKGS